MPFSEALESIKEKVLEKYQDQFQKIDRNAEINTLKVLDAMRKNRVSEAYFHTTSGYAYDDLGRARACALAVCIRHSCACNGFIWYFTPWRSIAFADRNSVRYYADGHRL